MPTEYMLDANVIGCVLADSLMIPRVEACHTVILGILPDEVGATPEVKLRARLQAVVEAIKSEVVAAESFALDVEGAVKTYPRLSNSSTAAASRAEVCSGKR